MNILSIESSFDVCGASLILGGKHIDTIETRVPRMHSKFLAVYVEEVLRKNKATIEGIDCIAVSVGPGSYTGLRIGVSLAKGLALPFSKPIHPVDSFDIARSQINEKSNFSIAFHSHRNFVYHCYVDKKGSMSVPEICSIDKVVAKKIYGYNLKIISESLNYIEIMPSAKVLAEYALANSNIELPAVNNISPIYLSISNED